MPLIIKLMILNKIIITLSLLFVINQLAFSQVIEENFENKALESGPKIAKIVVPRAIVYSDEDMNSAMGFIPNGKLIYVGNPRKKNPDLISVLINGQIAYIQIKDIHFEDEIIQNAAKDGAPKEHNIDLILKKPEEKLTENNSVFFSFGSFSLGTEYEQFLSNLDQPIDSTATYLDILIIHRKEFSRFLWGLNWSSYFISNNDYDFSYFMLGPTFGFTILKNPVFLLDVYTSVDFAVGTDFDIKINYEKDPSPFLYGAQLGTKILFTPTLRYHIFGNLAYKYYNVTQMDQVFNASSNYVPGFKRVNGISIGLGVSFDL